MPILIKHKHNKITGETSAIAAILTKLITWSSLPNIIMSCPSSPSSVRVNLDNQSRKVKFDIKLPKLPKIHQKAALPKSKPRYFTAGCEVNDENRRDFKKETSPFAYPEDVEELAYQVMTKTWKSESRREELSKKYNQRQNYKSRQQIDLLHRLYVPEPKIKSTQMIADIDPDFFKIVQGRPIPEKLNLRKYIDTIRKVLRTKILIGYRGDDIMLIDENLIKEQKEIDRIRNNYQMYVNTFEEFLYNDHTTSMNLLKESDKASLLAQEKSEEYRKLSRDYAALKSTLYSTEEKWKSCKLYQRFLYMVSPMSWRKQHDFYYTKDEELGGFQNVSQVFAKYRLNVTDENSSIQDLISEFKKECETQQEPLLYFTDPNQLLDVFRFMELQNLNSLLHSEELAVPLQMVKEGMAKAEMMFNEEINVLQETIDKLSDGIA